MLSIILVSAALFCFSLVAVAVMFMFCLVLDRYSLNLSKSLIIRVAMICSGVALF